jgi:hypothetical protein
MDDTVFGMDNVTAALDPSTSAFQRVVPRHATRVVEAASSQQIDDAVAGRIGTTRLMTGAVRTSGRPSDLRHTGLFFPEVTSGANRLKTVTGLEYKPLSVGTTPLIPVDRLVRLTGGSVNADADAKDDEATDTDVEDWDDPDFTDEEEDGNLTPPEESEEEEEEEKEGEEAGEDEDDETDSFGGIYSEDDAPPKMPAPTRVTREIAQSRRRVRRVWESFDENENRIRLKDQRAGPLDDKMFRRDRSEPSMERQRKKRRALLQKRRRNKEKSE